MQPGWRRCTWTTPRRMALLAFRLRALVQPSSVELSTSTRQSGASTDGNAVDASACRIESIMFSCATPRRWAAAQMVRSRWTERWGLLMAVTVAEPGDRPGRSLRSVHPARTSLDSPPGGTSTSPSTDSPLTISSPPTEADPSVPLTVSEPTRCGRRPAAMMLSALRWGSPAVGSSVAGELPQLGPVARRGRGRCGRPHGRWRCRSRR